MSAGRTTTMTLKTVDQSSKTFKDVGQNAQKMADQIKKSAASADAALEDMGEAAESSGNKMQVMTQQVRDIGLGVGVLIGTAAGAGKMFRDQEVALSTLGRTYGDTAESMQEFAEALQDSTNFSNDAGIEAANLFGTLSRNYAFTADQIQNLITISADLAATSGIGLADAALRVQSAMRGEAESAELLGLTMNDASLGIDRMAVTTTNAEKAQIRYQAIIEQSAFATGAAAEQADTMYGSMTQLRDVVQDNMQAFGEWLGPLGEVGAFAADNAIQMAVLSLGVGQVGKSAMAASGMMKTMATAAGFATRSAFLLSTALGPVGIVAAAIAAVAGLALLSRGTESWSDETQGGEEAAQSFTEAIRVMGEQAALTGSTLTLATLLTEVSDALQENTIIVAENEAVLESLTARQELLNQQSEEAAAAWEMQVSDIEELTDAQKELVISMVGQTITAGELDYAIESLNATTKLAAEESEAFKITQDGIIEVLQAQGTAFADNKSQLTDWINLFLDGKMKQDVFIAGVQGFVEELHAEQLALALGTETLGGYNAALDESAAAQNRWFESGGTVLVQLEQLAGLGPSVMSFWNGFSPVVNSAGEAVLTTSNALNILLGLINEGPEGSGGRAGPAFHGLAMSLSEDLEPSLLTSSHALNELLGLLDHVPGGGRGEIQAMASEFHGLAMSMDLVSPEDLANGYEELGRTFDSVAASYTNTTVALDAGFRIIVGNTNDIASTAKSVSDWSAGIVVATEHQDEWGNSLGWWSVADELVANHSITQQEYGAAVAANNSIQNDSAMIQNDILAIQTKQAPVLAGLMASQARYVNEVANMEAPAQALALAYMDNATAAQAMTMAQVAMSEAPGFEGLIQGAIAANPYLEQILTDMGIVSRGAEGELIINTTGETEMESLTRAIEALNTTFTTLITVEVDDSQFVSWADTASKLGDPFGEGGSGKGGLNFVVTMTADNSDVTNKINDSTDKMTTWSTTTGTGKALADNSDALGKIMVAEGNLGEWDSASGSAALMADGSNAVNAINTVSGLLSALDGDSATTYINTVYTTTYQTVGSPTIGLQHGGSIPFAQHGRAGRSAIVGEAGWELLLGGNGGGGGMILPHTASKESVQGSRDIVVPINIEGNVYGIPDLSKRIIKELVPALSVALDQQLSSRGVA